MAWRCLCNLDNSIALSNDSIDLTDSTDSADSTDSTNEISVIDTGRLIDDSQIQHYIYKIYQMLRTKSD